MAKYIKREAVKEMLENAQICSEGEYSGYYTEDVKIDDIPVENVVPVVYGVWNIKQGNYITGGGKALWCCSNCGYVAGVLFTRPKYNYCPNCGANMGGLNE